MPQVSVVMPVYNAEEYLAEATESILKQTFKDFEFIIINDGSSDGSLEILQAYAQQDSRIQLVSRPNTGLAGALNEGLALANAPLIARMDADDIALPNRLQIQTEFLQQHSDVVCVGGCFEVIDHKARILWIADERIRPLDNAAIQQKLIDGHSVLCHPSVVMRTAAVNQAGGYDHNAVPAEDYDLWLRLGEMGKLANVGQIVLRYREHPASISTKRHQEQLEKTRQVCTRAWERRGIQGQLTQQELRPTTPEAVYHTCLKYGHLGFNRGDRHMARDYAWQAMRLRPFGVSAWRLFIKSLVKSPPVGP